MVLHWGYRNKLAGVTYSTPSTSAPTSSSVVTRLTRREALHYVCTLLVAAATIPRQRVTRQCTQCSWRLNAKKWTITHCNWLKWKYVTVTKDKPAASLNPHSSCGQHSPRSVLVPNDKYRCVIIPWSQCVHLLMKYYLSNPIMYSSRSKLHGLYF